MMKILITSGGTSEKIDDVRSITNKSTGQLGSLIAEAYQREVPSAEIYYLCSPTAEVPAINNLHIHRAVNVADVYDSLSSLVGKLSFDIIIHAMAISDYAFDGLISVEKLAASLAELEGYDESSLIRTILEAKIMDMRYMKKIESAHDSLILFLKKTPKVISFIRNLQANSIFVGFKLMVDVSQDMLIDTAYNLLENNGCDFVFANDLVNIQDINSHRGFLVKQDKTYIETSSKLEAAMEIVLHTLDLIRKK